MEIRDCKTIQEFFGVGYSGSIWIDGVEFKVTKSRLVTGVLTDIEDGQALIGCITGQLKWSTTPTMTDGETALMCEIAAWFPCVHAMKIDEDGDIWADDCEYIADGFVFGTKHSKSKAYELLAPILERHGTIKLDDYREVRDDD